MIKVKTIIINMISFLILLIFLIFTLYFINIVVYKYFLESKTKLLEEFKELTGFNIKYKKLSPNIISSIKVFEVVIYDDLGTKLEVGDLEVDYSIIAFLKNKKNFLSIIKKVKLNTFSFSASKEDILNKVNVIRSKFNNSKTSQSKNKDLLNLQNLVFEIKNGKIGIIDKDNRYSVNLNDLKITFKNQIKIDSLISLKVDINKKFYGNITVKINGVIKDLKNIATNFNLDFQKIELNNIKLKRQKISFENNGLDIKIERLKDLLPVRLLLTKNKDLLNAKISLDNFIINDFLITKLKQTNLPKSIILKADVSYNLKSKEINGNLDFDVFFYKLAFFKNLKIVGDIDILKNVTSINNIRVYNGTNYNFIDLKGVIPLNLEYFTLDLKLKDFNFPSVKLNSDIFLKKQNNNIYINSDYLLVNGNDLGRLSYNIEIQKNKYIINSLNDLNGYSLNGIIYNNKNKFSAFLEHNFNNFSISTVVKSFKKDFKPNFFMDGKVKTNIINNDISIEESMLTLNDGKNQLSSFKINLNNKILNFYDLIVYKYNVTSKGYFDFGKIPAVFFANINKDKYDFNITSTISKDRINFFINDQFSSLINLSGKYLTVKADKFKIPYKDREIEVNFDFVFDIKNQRIKENSFSIDNISLFAGENGKITSNMIYEDNFLIFDNFVYSDNSNKISGKITNEFYSTDRLRLSASGFLKDEGKGESYSISYKITDDQIDGKLYVTHMDIKKFIKNNFKGFLNLRFNIYGDIKDPNIDFDGNITEAKIGKNDLVGYFFVKKLEDKIFIKKLFLQLGGNKVYVKDSDVLFDKNNKKIINIGGNIYFEGLSKILKTDFSIKGEFTDFKDNENPLSFDINFDKITLGFLKGSSFGEIEKFPAIQFNLSKNESTYVFKNYGKKIIYATKKDGSYLLKLYNEEQNVLDSKFEINKENVDGNFVFTKFPINVVYRLLKPYVGVEGGLLDGEIQLKGTKTKPEYYGRLNLYYGIVDLPQYLQEKITNITGIIVADKNKILVNNVNGVVRNGNAHGYGEVVFNGLKFEGYSFKLNSDMVPALIKAGPVDARGWGLVENFTIEARDGSFNFIADLLIDQAEINLASLIGGDGRKNSDPPKTIPINVFINFKAGKKVKVNYPIIKGNIKEGDVFTVKYIGSEPNIYLGGLVGLDKGEINYFNKSFKIEKATFQFDENDPKINPYVNISSFYRTRDTKGEQVKINLNVQDRLLSFKTIFTAIPYKSTEDINTLIGVAIATNTDNNFQNTNNNQNLNNLDNNQISQLNSDTIASNQNLDTIINTTNYFSNAFLFSPIENNIKRVTGLDTFSMNTEFFGNIIKSNTNLLDVLDNSSLTIGKYLSNEIYLGSSMTFKKKRTLQDMFFLPFQDKNYGLNLQFMLQVELPYVSFGYSFIPKENIINSDHKISFEANFKF